MKSIMLTASGGGHTGYSIAIARNLVKLSGNNVSLYFIVQEGDMWSSTRAGKYGEVIYVSRGRNPTEGLLKAMLRLSRGFIESISKVKKSNVTVCTGHNHSIPPCLVSMFKGSRLILVEDVFRIHSRGRSIRLLSRFSHLVALHWKEQRSLYENGVVVGPIYEDPVYKPWDGGYILVTTGTHGYKGLFDALLKTSLDNLVIQTGRIDPSYYKSKRPKWIVFDFTENIDRWIAGASVVITHIGMTAINSALAYRKPTIIVYNPEWKLAAPPQDALVVSSKINALFMTKPEPGTIEAFIEKARKMKPPRIPNGARVLARILLNLD
ncbi:MAG: polysaccharide biosynthesis protein [Desulfurococcales archaeon]|nr:polysaccharide biosynthesis protein [Desulfurococcales archaeon]